MVQSLDSCRAQLFIKTYLTTKVITLTINKKKKRFRFFYKSVAKMASLFQTVGIKLKKIDT